MDFYFLIKSSFHIDGFFFSASHSLQDFRQQIPPFKFFFLRFFSNNETSFSHAKRQLRPVSKNVPTQKQIPLPCGWPQNLSVFFFHEKKNTWKNRTSFSKETLIHSCKIWQNQMCDTIVAGGMRRHSAPRNLDRQGSFSHCWRKFGAQGCVINTGRLIYFSNHHERMRAAPVGQSAKPAARCLAHSASHDVGGKIPKSTTCFCFCSSDEYLTMEHSDRRHKSLHQYCAASCVTGGLRPSNLCINL